MYYTANLKDHNVAKIITKFSWLQAKPFKTPVRNAGATILQLLVVENEHPTANVLVEPATLQDEEVGDSTTSVVIIAAELMKNADIT